MAVLDDIKDVVTGTNKTTDTNTNQANKPATDTGDGSDPNFGPKVIAEAKNWLDVPYQNYGVTNKGIDAGGLVKVIYEKFGINFGTTYPFSQHQLFVDSKLTYSNKADIKAGDIVFFQGIGGVSKGVVSSVGILIGDGKFIIASATDNKVVTQLLSAAYYTEHFMCFGRITSNGALSVTAQKAAAKAKKTNAKASADGFKVTPSGTSVKIEKTPENKTFCEPIYPDLTVVTSEAPKYILDSLTSSQIAGMKQTEGGTYRVSNEELQSVYGIDMTSILGSAKDIEARQHIFDPETHKNTRKTFNPGKPANNNDAFPVDLKIEEFELHVPRIKVPSVTLTKPSGADVTLAKTILNVADRAEKRIVKLENNMATILRLLHRLGSRISVNCVYYGGQDKNQKYTSIRCLHDNRIDDGQCMSIDQCACCTRYEPIFGQTYDILNDIGSNLAAILDDNQMSYSTMTEYIEGAKVDKFHEERAKGKIEMASVKSRDLTAKDFKDIWTEGYKQDWTLVPVEDQKPGINWRQSLLDDGGKLKKLGSYQYNKNNFANTNQAIKPGAMADMMKMHMDAMNNNQKSSLQGYIDDAKTLIDAEYIKDVMANINSVGYLNDIMNVSTKAGVDAVLALAIIAVESRGVVDARIDEPDGYWGCMQTEAARTREKYPDFTTLEPLSMAQAGLDVGTSMYNGKISATATTNPLVAVTAYNAGQGVFVDNNINPLITETAANMVVDSATGATTYLFTWEERETYTYPLIGEAMKERLEKLYDSGKVTEAMEYFPKVCFAYNALATAYSATLLDTSILIDPSGFRFPFTQSSLDSGSVYFTSPYGWRVMDGENRYHNGVDIGAPEGTPLYAVKPGTVTIADGTSDPDGYGTHVCIVHDDGTSSVYGHMSSLAVSVGQKVTKDDLIGAVGNSGHSTGAHLHLSISSDDKYYTGNVNPTKIFVQLQSISVGDAIS